MYDAEGVEVDRNMYTHMQFDVEIADDRFRFELPEGVPLTDITAGIPLPDSSAGAPDTAAPGGGGGP
jgi:hypothetical protein